MASQALSPTASSGVSPTAATVLAEGPPSAVRSTGPSVLGDTHAYLHKRVELFTRTVCLVVAGFLALSVGLTFVLDTPKWWLNPARGLPPLASCLLFALAWRHVRRAECSERALRAVEIAVTLLTCFGSGLAPLNNPASASPVLGLIHVSAVGGCVLVLRGAVVPSPPLTTLAVSVVGVAPVFVTAWHGWDLALGGMSPRAAGLSAMGFVSAGYVAVATIVSRIVHRLRSKVAEAMQLGQYTLEEKIGEGGMGAVYKARHALLRRPTAVKLLPPDKAGERAIARFEREVQQTSRLTHPNTVAIFDYGHTPEGVFYYAMEYLDGISLDDLVELAGPQPAGRVIHVVAQVAEALAEAHGFGLIHRDVKPANIALCHRGGIPDHVKVLDFGLVKDVGAPGEVALSTTATITGTPLYLAPEQLVDPGAVDARTDIYALGGVAYFLLTGKPMFEGKTMVEVCSHHLHSIPPPPSSHTAGGVDDDLEALVLRCLAKKQADRPPSALALRAELRCCRAAASWSREQAEAWWDEHRDAVARLRRSRAEPVSTTAPRPACRIAARFARV
jgi:serine/threonine-protein kinase